MASFRLSHCALYACVFVALFPTAFSKCPYGFNACDGAAAPCAMFASACGNCTAGELVCPGTGGSTTVPPQCVAATNEGYLQCSLQAMPWRNSSLPVAQRVGTLVQALLNTSAWSSQLDNTSPAVEELGIPAYNWWNEGLHGVAFSGLATMFPQVILTAASFDKELWTSIGQAIALEGRGKHNNYMAQNDRLSPWTGVSFYAPNINIFRDPRWGRGQETPGEDPFLTGQYAKHLLLGLQTQDENGVYEAIGCCKHASVYSLDNYTNSEGVQVTRMSFNAVVEPSDMKQTYMPAFQTCIQEGKARSVMCSYNAINGVPACADGKMMNHMLRDMFGFDGFVVSDYGAIPALQSAHHYVNTTLDGVVAAISAGCDQDGAGVAGGLYGRLLPNATATHLINTSVVATALSRVVSARVELGLLDPPGSVPYNDIPYSVVGSTPHTDLARTAAEKAIVLMTNRNGTLPLASSPVPSLAVVGPIANTTTGLLGDYAGSPPSIVSVLEGLQAVAGDVTYSVGCEGIWCTSKALFGAAEQAAAAADVTVLVVGLSQSVETETHDRTFLTLPGYQHDLVQDVTTAAHGTGGKVVLVVVCGGPVSINWEIENVDAVLWAGYPGEQGGAAISNVLFGKANPAGKVPVTWLSSLSDLPPYPDMSMTASPGRTYRYYSGVPLVPFGHGGSYSQFQYSGLAVSKPSFAVCEAPTVTFSVASTNGKVGDAVTLVFVTGPAQGGVHPRTNLGNFTRVTAVGSTGTTATIELSPRRIASIDAATNQWVVLAGKYSLWVGTGQEAVGQISKSPAVVHSGFSTQGASATFDVETSFPLSQCK